MYSLFFVITDETSILVVYLFLISAMQTYSFAQLDNAIQTILAANTKLIYIAWASASGKTYITEEIAKRITSWGKKVLTISSDNYYVSDTWIKSVIYGTYDHPALIDYALLAKNIEEYMNTGSFMLPTYSFAESRRTGFIKIDTPADVVIVEWLYTISQLPDKHNPFAVYIWAAQEDLIIRRLLRDPARVGEPLHMVIGALNNVFPMWHLYGAPQEKTAHVTIFNDYDLLAKDGKSMFHEPLNGTSLDNKVEYNRETIIEYRYNDSTDDAAGKVLITEHYDAGFLKSVGVSKTQSTPHGKPETIKHISLRIYKPWVLTQIHNLVQNAGLEFEWYTAFDQTIYVDAANKQYIVEHRKWGEFIRYEE